MGDQQVQMKSRKTWLTRSISIILAAMVGVFITLQAQSWWVSIHPNVVQIENTAVQPLPDGGWLLIVKINGPPSRNCLRISQHLMYQRAEDRALVLQRADGNDDLPEFLPLGSAMNGLGFNSPAYDIKVVLKIHPGTPLGTWWYIDRSAYFCTELGLSRIVQSQTEPRKIVLTRSP